MFRICLLIICESTIRKNSLPRQLNTEALIKTCYRTSYVQTKAQIALGEVNVTFTNQCEDVSMTITQVGLSVKPYAGLGAKTTSFRKDQVIIPPQSSVERIYSINISDKVIAAYSLKEGGIKFSKAD